MFNSPDMGRSSRTGKTSSWQEVGTAIFYHLLKEIVEKSCWSQQTEGRNLVWFENRDQNQPFIDDDLCLLFYL
jgi:hypothetical protein